MALDSVLSTRHAALRVVIVGGGLIGSACAYFLARAGCAVTVVERERLGGQTSTVAAGILAPAAEAEPEGPFFALAQASLALFSSLATQLEQETGIDIDLARPGVLVLAYEPAEVEHLRSQEHWLRSRGLGAEWLGAAALRKVEPAISPDALGGLRCADGAHVSAERLAQALLAGAARRGARLIDQTPVVGLISRGGEVVGVRAPHGVLEADAVILAGGAWAGMWGEWAGLEIPVEPVKGQLVALRMVPAPVQHIIFGRKSYIVPKKDGTIILGATMERVGYDRRVTAAGLSRVLSHLPLLAPTLGDAEVVAVRAGLRPASPDGLPIIGRAPGQARLWLAAGHFRNGVLLSPITGQLVAELLLGQPPSIDCAPFSPARFAGV